MQMPRNLLYHVFEGRLKMLSCRADFAGSLKYSLYDGSRCYELVGVKLQENHSAGAVWQKQKARLHVFNLQVARPGMVRHELERLGNFSELSPPMVRILKIKNVQPLLFIGC